MLVPVLIIKKEKEPLDSYKKVKYIKMDPRLNEFKYI